MYKKNPNIILRKLEPSFFMVDITKCYNNEEERMFITDEVGAEIWNTIEDRDTFEDIYKKFLGKLTDKKTEEFLNNVRVDMTDFISLLISQECLYEV